MAYKLIFTPDAYASLDKLDNSVRIRIGQVLDKLKENPQLGKPLHGKWDYYRARFLSYRPTYTIDEKESTVTIVEIGKRDSIYR